MDFMYLTGSGNSISSDKISGTLSGPRYDFAVTTINYNGVDYAVFGGGVGSSDVVDLIYLTGSGSNITVNRISGTLQSRR